MHPLGGVDLRCGHFLVKMYAKTKELGPIGGMHWAHPPPPRSANGSFGYFHLVVWSQFAFGSLPPPPPPPRLVVYPKLPRFDQNFLDTGLGFASQRIFLRKANEEKVNIV